MVVVVVLMIVSVQVGAPPDFWNSWFWLDPWLAGMVEAPSVSFRHS